MTVPIWLTVARKYAGLHEGHNPTILGWAARLGRTVAGWFTDDVAQPWCAIAMNAWLSEAGLPMSGDGFDLVRAASFLTYGAPLVEPALGAIMVFHRPGGYHVGLYLGERPDAYRVWGGNQSNQVGPAWIAKTANGQPRLAGLRWPPGVALPAPGGEILLAADGSPVSFNEA